MRLSLKPPSGARRALLAAALVISIFAVLRTGAAQSSARDLLEPRYPKTVVLVRHAEKASDDPRDPSLSEQGAARARELARVLRGAGVSDLFATEFKRTRDTLEPLAQLTGAPVQIVSARDPKAQVSAIASLPRGAVAVVAGHSNTVPALVHLLAPEHEEFALTEDDYAQLYVVTLTAAEGPATVLELRYGAE